MKYEFMTFEANYAETLNRDIYDYCKANKLVEVFRSSPAVGVSEQGYTKIFVTCTLRPMKAEEMNQISENTSAFDWLPLVIYK